MVEQMLSKQKIKEFLQNNETPFFASSLSFFTIFAIVPTLLILISVLTYISGIDKTISKIKSFIFEFFIPVHQQIIEKYIDGFFHNSQKLGIVGLFYIVVTSILFFLNYETIISKIFNLKKRNFWEALTTYWTLMTLSPIALSLSFYFSKETQNALLAIGISKDDMDVSLLLPFFLIWFIFFINYKISPNKKTLLKPVLISSFVASVVWYMAKVGFIFYITHNTTYSSLYGSFSILIVFFLWIYISWMIYIYGLEFLKFLEKRGERVKE